MARYNYALGTSNPPTNVEIVTATAEYPAGRSPRGRFYEASVLIDQLDGHVAGHGAAVAVWVFDALTQAMVNQLRAICPGRSANVYLATRKPDGTFATYSAIMVWPVEQMDRRNFNGRYLGLEFTFRNLEAV